MKVVILRKLVSSVITAIILSGILTLIHGQVPFLIYMIYAAIGCLFIGVPCSIIIDLVILKIKRTMIELLLGFTLHLIFAGIAVYLIYLTEDDHFLIFLKYANAIVYSTFLAATGLWFVDALLKYSVYRKT